MNYYSNVIACLFRGSRRAIFHAVQLAVIAVALSACGGGAETETLPQASFSAKLLITVARHPSFPMSKHSASVCGKKSGLPNAAVSVTPLADNHPCSHVATTSILPTLQRTIWSISKPPPSPDW